MKLGLAEFETQKIGKVNHDHIPAYADLMADLCRSDPNLPNLKTEKQIWDFLRTLTYVPDDQIQTFRTVNHTLREGYANCVNSVIVGAALLKNANIPFKYCIVKYEPQDKNWVHIFLETENGCIDGTFEYFHGCVPYYEKKCYYPMEGVVMNSPYNSNEDPVNWKWLKKQADKVGDGIKAVADKAGDVAKRIDTQVLDELYNPAIQAAAGTIAGVGQVSQAGLGATSNILTGVGQGAGAGLESFLQNPDTWNMAAMAGGAALGLPMMGGMGGMGGMGAMGGMGMPNNQMMVGRNTGTPNWAMQTPNQGFDIEKYLPYILGGIGLILIMREKK
jgi:hypothetical protein